MERARARRSAPTTPAEAGRRPSTTGGADVGAGRRKRDAVLGLPRGEAPGLLSRELGVTAAELSGRRAAFLAAGAAFLAAGAASLQSRPADARDGEIGRLLRAEAGEPTMANEPLGAKIERPPAGALWPPPEGEAMGRVASPSTGRPPRRRAGDARTWGVSRASVHRASAGGRLGRSDAGGRGRAAPCRTTSRSRRSGGSSGPAPAAARAPRKSRARLRFEGVRTSRRRVLGLTGEHRLLAHQRVPATPPGGARAHHGTIATARVDRMWGTDLTPVMTGEGRAAVSVAVDHGSAECAGVHARAAARPGSGRWSRSAGACARALRGVRRRHRLRPGPAP